MPRTLEVRAGNHLHTVLVKALEEAQGSGETVTFDFNGVEHTVHPVDDLPAAVHRAEQLAGHPIRTPAEDAAEAGRRLERTRAEQAAAIAEAGVQTEAEMREATPPTFESAEALTDYIRGLTDRPHDYGTCVYAMSLAATAAFNFVAVQLGVTGFQASAADLDILRRTRHMEHGFRIVDYRDLLYPQHWDDARTPLFQEVLKHDEPRQRFAEAARKLFDGSPLAAESVLAHWRSLAELAEPVETSQP